MFKLCKLVSFLRFRVDREVAKISITKSLKGGDMVIAIFGEILTKRFAWVWSLHVTSEVVPLVSTISRKPDQA